MNRNDACYCGKDKKLKQCHLETYRAIKDFTKYRVMYDLTALESLSKKIKRIN
jgi:hypothetical protein